MDVPVLETINSKFCSQGIFIDAAVVNGSKGKFVDVQQDRGAKGLSDVAELDLAIVGKFWNKQGEDEDVSLVHSDSQHSQHSDEGFIEMLSRS